MMVPTLQLFILVDKLQKFNTCIFRSRNFVVTSPQESPDGVVSVIEVFISDLFLFRVMIL